MSDGIELDPALRAKIDELLEQLEDLDHYALLGVGRDADRRAVKVAFNAYVSRLHPDRHFGRNLGAYKAKMEQVFVRLTAAHDTLASPQRRAEYDEYLAERSPPARLDAVQPVRLDVAPPVAPEPAPPSRAVAIPPPAPPPEFVVERPGVTPGSYASVARAPGSYAVVASVAPAPAVTAPAVTAPATPVAPATPSPPMSMPPPSSPEADRLRREALARRLVGAKSGGATRTSSTPSMSAVRSATPSIPIPRTSSSSSIPAARSSMFPDGPSSTPTPTAFTMGLEALVQSARTAAEAGDYVTASTRMRLAAKLDESLLLEADKLSLKANEAMAQEHVERARADEADEKWPTAALAWGKAAEGLPQDAGVAERAANALRIARGDMHKAVRYAERAVSLAPTNVPYRLTLVEVYLDVGLLKRARGELDQVLRVAPKDGRALQLDLILKRRS